MREIYAKSIDDVASGLENLHKVGLENLGVVGFKTPKQLAKSVKAIASRLTANAPSTRSIRG